MGHHHFLKLKTGIFIAPTLVKKLQIHFNKYYVFYLFFLTAAKEPVFEIIRLHSLRSYHFNLKFYLN